MGTMYMKVSTESYMNMSKVHYCFCYLTLKVLNFWKFSSYCSFRHGGSSAGSYLADPTSPIPSHCALIVATSTLRVNSVAIAIHHCSHSSIFVMGLLNVIMLCSWLTVFCWHCRLHYAHIVHVFTLMKPMKAVPCLMYLQPLCAQQITSATKKHM